MFSLAILLYSVVLAIICPRLKKGGKKLITVVLCLLPLIAALIHLAIYGLQAFWIFFYLYIEALIPLINLLPGRKKLPVAIKIGLVIAHCFGRMRTFPVRPFGLANCP